MVTEKADSPVAGSPDGHSLVADHSFESLLDELIAGNSVRVSGSGAVFTLENIDSRSLLTYYKRRTDLWNASKRIDGGEVDELLAVLEKPPGILTPKQAPTKAKAEIWHLRKVQAHRFGGLHRHCVPATGGDPEIFEAHLSSELSIVHGFNGAGKTSLLNAITWCLTGKAFRSQEPPSEIHEPITLKLIEDGGKSSDELGETEARPRELQLPPVVPIPSHEDLLLLGDIPRTDTWVRLTFESGSDGRIVAVKRSLQKSNRGAFSTVVEGISDLALPSLALEISTVMPGAIAHIRLGEKSALGEAIAVLTGLRPFEELGKRTQRLHKRLETVEVGAADTKLIDLVVQFKAAFLKYEEQLRITPSVAPEKQVAPLVDNEGDEGCRESLKALKIEVVAIREKAAVDAKEILGAGFDSSKSEQLSRSIAPALEAISAGELRELKGMTQIQAISKITAEDVAIAEATLEELSKTGTRLAKIMSEPLKAARLRLYAQVAIWHEDLHPGIPIKSCPVCGTDLSSIPPDSVLDLSVAAALQAAQNAEYDLRLSAMEWEVQKRKELAAGLPASIRQFIEVVLPDSMLDLYNEALSALKSKSEFLGALSQIPENGKKIWAEEVKGLPASVAVVAYVIPEVFPDKAGLRAAIRNIAKAISFQKYRETNADVLRDAVRRTFYGEKDQEKSEKTVKSTQLPLKMQLIRLEQFCNGIRPIGLVIGELDAMAKLEETHSKTKKRRGLLKRAAIAVKPYMDFQSLVRTQVDGLLKEIESSTKGWANRIYRPHYNAVPAFAGVTQADGAVLSLDSRIGNIVVPAHEILNASSIRAVLWALLLALWQRIRERRGALSIVLMDDPQSTFDTQNALNFASSIPDICSSGIRPLVASNDQAFVSRITASADAKGFSAISAWDISPLSSAKLVASLVPRIDEIRKRRAAWLSDENNSTLATQFLESLRVHLEAKLWDTLCNDTYVHQKPTLATLRDRVAALHSSGVHPFNQLPFKRLVECPHLRSGAEFYEKINAAHHGKARNLTPAEASAVNVHVDAVRTLVDDCQTAYLIHVERLPKLDQAEGMVADVPQAHDFAANDFPFLGQIAAKSMPHGIPAEDSVTQKFSLKSLGRTALFGIRAPTLGLACLPGQTAIVSLDHEPDNGDLVICLYRDRVYARRLATRDSDTSEIALESVSFAGRSPHTFWLPRSSTRLLKIVGVLFDNQKLQGEGDAILVTGSAVLAGVAGGLEVKGDSAIPVALPGQMILVRKWKGDLGDLNKLAGGLVAVVDGDDEVFVKRLGAEIQGMPGVRLLEKIGVVGESICRYCGSEPLEGHQVPSLKALWEVCGVLYDVSLKLNDHA